MSMFGAARARAGADFPPWLYVAIGAVTFLGAPTMVYISLAHDYPDVLHFIHYFIATAYLFTSMMMVRESLYALPRRMAPVPHTQVLSLIPRVTIIICAYLPNEQDLIAETLMHITTTMRVPSYKLQIILAYNTPHDLPIEKVLDRLRKINSSFTPLSVTGSHSKAENILAALPHATGEMTVVFDADHHPQPDAIERAYRWLLRGYDVVQGRCVVRNQKETWLTRYISVEFEQIYAIFHAGRSLDVDTAIFAGTNGYWRTSVLRQLGMDTTMLTEDIDSSVRAILSGFRLVHDRSIISTELATQTMAQWWKQRQRWAQGWFQVTLRHQVAIWRSPRLTPRQKLYWTYLLSWRELFPFLGLQIIGLVAAAIIAGTHIDWFSNPYLVLSTIVTLVSGPISVLAAYRVALWRTKDSLRWWFVISAATSIIYATAKNIVAMAAVVRELLGHNAWVVTSRGPSVAPSLDAQPVEAPQPG